MRLERNVAEGTNLIRRPSAELVGDRDLPLALRCNSRSPILFIIKVEDIEATTSDCEQTEQMCV